MRRRSIRLYESLEIKLPFLIGSLVTLLLLSVLALTQYELRQGAVEASTERLTRISHQLADIFQTSSVPRLQQLREASAEPAVIALLRGTGDPDAAAAVLQSLRTRADSGLSTQLRSADGRLIAFVGDGAHADVPAAAIAESISYGPLTVRGGEGFYWVGAPVAADGVLLGHILQQRRFGSRAAGEQIEQLAGSNIEIFVANPGGGQWVGVDGLPGPAASVTTLDAPFSFEDARGVSYRGVAARVYTGWYVVASIPVEQALARTRDVTRRLLLFGLLLLAGGGVAAWMVSRSVTSPLRRLSAAADAIAAGDYSRRTGVDRADEIGRLAESFDDMAARVQQTHEELQHRFNEARSLAAELEATNARLQSAMAEVEAARRDAQQASRAKSDFLATISHEIRTPINAIIGYTELMEMGLGGSLTEQHADYVDRIRRSGAHLTALVNDVLDFAKIESGQMRVSREVRSVPAAIHGAVDMLQQRIDEKHLEVQVSCPLDALFLGDAQRLEQILINLLGNAVKFTDEDGRITLSVDRRVSAPHPAEQDGSPHEWTCVSVTDTGPGIAADQFEAIFQPFVQGTSGYTRPHGGTGLGLAISRSLARMMGGDLSVESTPGVGSSFTVWLPHPAGIATMPV